MGASARSSLRNRLVPPSDVHLEASDGQVVEIERLLRIAANLFDVRAAALVTSNAGRLALAASWASGPWSTTETLAVATTLLDWLSAAETPSVAGVLEDIASGRGFRAAAPVMSADGRLLGAICLFDPQRQALLSGLKRRLLAEFAGLSAEALAARREPEGCSTPSGEPMPTPSRLQEEADRSPEAFAIFDAEGRCLLRNHGFLALLGGQAEAVSVLSRIDACKVPQGQEAAWLQTRIARDLEPVGIYRVAQPGGVWISIEERRTPHGHSLLGRNDP